MKWITRERPKIDRIACPWLIRRFIQPDAEFLFVPADQVFNVAKQTGATPYDIPGASPFEHDGDLCSFDCFIRHFGIRDSALNRLAIIVRGADTARHDLAPEASGLHAISMGLSINFPMTTPCSSRGWSSTTPCIPGAAGLAARFITGSRSPRPRA